MKNNMNTTLEIPEGSKAVISGKVIDGKNYLVVEVEQEPEKSNTPECKKFKRGDVLIYPDPENEMFVIFDEYTNNSNHACFSCIFNVTSDENTLWMTNIFRKATKEEKERFYKWLREEKGLEWDGEKLVEVLKEGDLAIFWDYEPREAIIAIYKQDVALWIPKFVCGNHVDHTDRYWRNAIKWDGTQEQFEKVLRGEL